MANSPHKRVCGCYGLRPLQQRDPENLISLPAGSPLRVASLLMTALNAAKTVLIVSYNPEVLKSQKQALIAAEYRVQECGSLSAALGAVGPGKIDLMVLSPDIPVGDRRRMEAEAKRRNQKVKIVLFCEGEKPKDVFASAILSTAETPDVLLDIASRLLP